MNRTSANLLLEGKAEIRSIGQPCDASCAMWFCCQNSTPNGTCKGFVLLNGKSKDILRKNMREDDLIYLENSARIIQNGCSVETRRALASEVYRYLKPINDILREEPALGFRAMLDKAIEPTPEESTWKPITRGFKGGFAGMLEEASRGTDSESMSSVLIRSLEFRTNEEVHQPQWGLKAMLDAASEGIKRSLPQHPVKPKRKMETVRGFGRGFAGMIDELTRGNEKEEVQTVVRNCGFKGILEDAFERESAPISFERQLRAILNAR